MDSRGERGPQGDHGQHGDAGRRGPKGEAGAQGLKGEPGVSSAFSDRRVQRAFVGVVLVSFAVVTFLFWELHQTRQVARSNQVTLTQLDETSAKIAQLRKTQEASCRNFETLKTAVNDFHGTIRALLIRTRETDRVRAKHIKNPALKKVDQQSVVALTKILAKTHTVSASCAQPKPKPKPAK